MNKEMLFVPFDVNPNQEKRDRSLVQAITQVTIAEGRGAEKFDARARAMERAKILEKIDKELDEARRVPRELLDKEFVI